MPLANVNISLKQFQDISCGKFNAGEVRLRGAPTSIPPNPSARYLFTSSIILSHFVNNVYTFS